MEKMQSWLLSEKMLIVKCMTFFIFFASSVFAKPSPGTLAAQKAPPIVVVTIKPIYGLVASLMQDVAVPTLLCDRGASAHTLSLSPSDIKTLSAADLVVWVGASYEMTMAKPLMKAIRSNELLTLDHVKGLVLHQQRMGGLFPGKGCQHCCDHDHSHDDEDHHEHSSIDGHFWLDIENAKICARAIADVLIRRWPEYKEAFSRNLEKLLSDLTLLKSEIGFQLASVQGKVGLIDHDSLQYFEKQFGFIIKGVLSDEHGMAPSAKHLEKLKEKLDASLDKKLINVFFYEGAVDGNPPSLLNNLAKAYAMRLMPLDYVGNQLPKSADVYQLCLRSIAAQIKAGFEG